MEESINRYKMYISILSTLGNGKAVMVSMEEIDLLTPIINSLGFEVAILEENNNFYLIELH